MKKFLVKMKNSTILMTLILLVGLNTFAAPTYGTVECSIYYAGSSQEPGVEDKILLPKKDGLYNKEISVGNKKLFLKIITTGQFIAIEWSLGDVKGYAAGVTSYTRNKVNIENFFLNAECYGY
jgi:hypothetical protein